ncbi:MAG: glutamate synthase subunit beta [Bacteroidales bacterium]|nr:glutamate synthase subunit beta [Bacteroidales bacterium]
MGNPKAFIEIKRKEAGYRPVKERITDFGEVEQTLNIDDRKLQASRCMDCGIPFCHWACTVGSKVPEWQDELYRGNIEEAARILQQTNDFPEFTGRICPALCEKSCVLAIHDEAVTIRENEASVMEQAFAAGLVKANPPAKRTGKKVAVIGSGPAGLSVAAQLNKKGHSVTVFEKDEKIGGLLRFGIPDFKLNKGIIDRRLKLLEEEGIVFATNTWVGKDISAKQLLDKYDAVCLSIGAMKPRDLNVKGRELSGVHFAMEYLTLQNRKIAGIDIPKEKQISAKDKNVIVIGGGDTGSDCVGTAIRQKAKSVKQIEILPKPPENRTDDNPWPFWPNTLRTSSSHQEGCERYWSLETKRLIGKNGKITHIELKELEWFKEDGQWKKKIISDKPIKFEADLVLLAMGFTQPVHEDIADAFKLAYDQRGNIKINEKHQTSNAKVFAAGDSASGASLVVRAIASGRNAAIGIDEFLIRNKS